MQNVSEDMKRLDQIRLSTSPTEDARKKPNTYQGNGPMGHYNTVDWLLKARTVKPEETGFANKPDIMQQLRKHATVPEP
jgi:hypothetical protein